MVAILLNQFGKAKLIYNIPSMIITCPWCGTNYTKFRSNCKNCGGVLPAPSKLEQGPKRRKLDMPTAPPRVISPNYLWRLMLTDGWSISALIFVLIGGLFSSMGAGLTSFIITVFVGMPLLSIGLPLLIAGAGLLLWRYRTAEKRVKVLKYGLAAKGEILDLKANRYVRVSGRTPWKISYAFSLDDQEYKATVTTLNPPGPHLAPGRPTVVLYLEDNPQFNGLYPHP